MPDPVTAAPVEAPDPFQGGEPTFEEFSKFRETGEVPERFKSATTEAKEAKLEKKPEPPAPPKEGETAEAKEASTTEQEKEGKDEAKKVERERDETGKFRKKVEFTPEQQEVFDRAFRKREAVIRQEYEERYAGQKSDPQATAAAEKPDTAAGAAQPTKPELPKLSTYKGTVEEYEKEVAEYPAKLQAYLDAQRSHQERTTAIEQRLAKSEAKAHKAHPDYKDEFEALADDIKNNEEPQLPPYVLKAIAEDADDPHELTYYLAKNRAEFRRLAALAPSEALREVLKLDVKLASAPAPAKEPAPPPKPKPPEPVGARAAATGFDVSDEKIDADEWARLRNEEVAKKRRR